MKGKEPNMKMSKTVKAFRSLALVAAFLTISPSVLAEGETSSVTCNYSVHDGEETAEKTVEKMFEETVEKMVKETYDLTVPNGVTCIGKWKFSGCENLITVNIPSNVTSIGDWAFYACNNITNVTIPSSVTSIGKDAFMRCDLHNRGNLILRDRYAIIDGCAVGFIPGPCMDGYWEVRQIWWPEYTLTLPEGTRLIADETFRDFSWLERVVLPSTLKIIGMRAFSGCTKLKTLTIPAGVTHIGTDAFEDCDNIKSISVAPGNPRYASVNGELVDKKDGSTVWAPLAEASFVPRCLKEDKSMSTDVKLTDDERDMLTMRSLELLAECGKASPGQPVLISPLSLAAAFSPLWLGAAGDVKDEIRRTFGLPDPLAPHANSPARRRRRFPCSSPTIPTSALSSMTSRGLCCSPASSATSAKTRAPA